MFWILFLSLFDLSTMKYYCDFSSKSNYCERCEVQSDCGVSGSEAMCKEIGETEIEVEGENEMIAYCIGNLTYKNKTYSLSDSKKKVALRLDDIQDYFLADAQIAIVRAIIEKKSKIDIGIIGSTFGKDRRLVKEIDRGVRLKNIEIFSHGWDTTVMEGTLRNVQKDLLEDTSKTIVDADICNWMAENTKVYTPHQNQFDYNTIGVLKEMRYNILSSCWPIPSTCDISPDTEIKLIPVGASTNTWLVEIMYEGVSAEQSLYEVNKQYEFCGFSVVMLHPQEYSNGKEEGGVNQTQIEQLKTLIDLLLQNNYEIQFLTQIADIQNSYVQCQPYDEDEFEEWREGVVDKKETDDGGDDDDSNPVVEVVTSVIFWAVIGSIVGFCILCGILGKVYYFLYI